MRYFHRVRASRLRETSERFSSRWPSVIAAITTVRCAPVNSGHLGVFVRRSERGEIRSAS